MLYHELRQQLVDAHDFEFVTSASEASLEAFTQLEPWDSLRWYHCFQYLVRLLVLHP
jgi:hypothetical protein